MRSLSRTEGPHVETGLTQSGLPRHVQASRRAGGPENEGPWPDRLRRGSTERSGHRPTLVPGGRWHLPRPCRGGGDDAAARGTTRVLAEAGPPAPSMATRAPGSPPLCSRRPSRPGRLGSGHPRAVDSPLAPDTQRGIPPLRSVGHWHAPRTDRPAREDAPVRWADVGPRRPARS